MCAPSIFEQVLLLGGFGGLTGMIVVFLGGLYELKMENYQLKKENSQLKVENFYLKTEGSDYDTTY